MSPECKTSLCQPRDIEDLPSQWEHTIAVSSNDLSVIAGSVNCILVNMLRHTLGCQGVLDRIIRNE
jgi:hypothetical protein